MLNRKGLPVDVESADQWFRSNEWEYLRSMISEAETDALASFVGSNANDAALMGRIQGTIRITRFIVDGSLRDAMISELKEKEKRNG